MEPTPPLTLIRVVDTETTGIDDPAEMVEIGWTDVRLFPTGWAIERGPESAIVNPGMPITFPAMAVHHLTDDDVRFGSDPKDIRDLVVGGVDILCAHNAAFDSRFIEARGRPWLCTFKSARTVWPDVQSHGNGSLRYELGLCIGDERTQPSHRAGPDTWVTAHILLKLLETQTVEQLIEISRNPVRLLKMPFGKHFGVPFSQVDGSYLDWLVNKSDLRDDKSKEDVIFTARAELDRRRGGRR